MYLLLKPILILLLKFPPTNKTGVKDSRAQKRINSDNSDIAVSKRPNLNDSLDSFSDQLEINFEGGTPHWVPLLFRSFGALRQEIRAFNNKLDIFESLKDDISKRVDSLEHPPVSTKKKKTRLKKV